MLRFRPLLPVLLTAISVSACGNSGERRPALPVQQASVLEAPFTDDIDTVSTLEANELVELAAQNMSSCRQHACVPQLISVL